MNPRWTTVILFASIAMPNAGGHAEETGDPEAGRQVFRACIACHSLAPGRHMTGPSLASIWGQEAGTVEGFTRYSAALEQADIIWDDDSLDAWLADPESFIPGNRMTFRGLPDATHRRDLIAFLRRVSEEEDPARGGPSAGMPGGMAGGGQLLDLKSLDANNRVTAIGHCGDTYRVTAETGEVYEFWEFNLRFKTDGSESGPPPGKPVIIPAGMRGDRASVVFAAPAEISAFIGTAC